MTVFDCSLPAFCNRRHVGATQHLVLRANESFLKEFLKEPLSRVELDIRANCAELRRPNAKCNRRETLKGRTVSFHNYFERPLNSAITPQLSRPVDTDVIFCSKQIERYSAIFVGFVSYVHSYAISRTASSARSISVSLW